MILNFKLDLKNFMNIWRNSPKRNIGAAKSKKNNLLNSSKSWVNMGIRRQVLDLAKTSTLMKS